MSTEADAEKQQAQSQKAQVLQQQYNKYQEILTEYQTQLSTISSQIQEHNIVDKTLSSIPSEGRTGRKCFKMIGGVLVDKSVDQVIQILHRDLKKLNELKEKLEKESARTKEEMESWMKKNNVKIVKGEAKE